MPSLKLADQRIKIRPVQGSWRVLVPLGALPIRDWLTIARTPHASYDAAFAAAQAWAAKLERLARCEREIAHSITAQRDPTLTLKDRVGAAHGELDWIVARQLEEESAP